MMTSRGPIVFKTRMPTSCRVSKPSDGRLADFVWPRASLPRTTKDETTYCCTPIIDGKKIFSRTLKCYLRQSWALDPELQEQAHGASARAQSQWGTQSGHQQRPHQLEDVALDGSNKAEKASHIDASSKPTSVPTLGMSFPRLCHRP